MKLAPLQEQTLYSALTFRHLLDSLARPGKINQLDYPDFLGGMGDRKGRDDCEGTSNRKGRDRVNPSSTPRQFGSSLDGDEFNLSLQAPVVNLYALGAMLTLLDREVTFVVAADGRWLSEKAPLAQWLALRSGAAVAAPASAQFAFFCQGRSNGLVTELNKGTLLEPEASTTAFYCVERLAERADELAENQHGVTLELSGPGIETTQKISIIGMDRDEIKLINTARGGYPLGIDMYLIDDLGRCIGLPRTTRIQLLNTVGTGLAPVLDTVGTGSAQGTIPMVPVQSEGKEKHNGIRRS